MESNSEGLMPGSGGGGGGFEIAAFANPEMLSMFVQMALSDPATRADAESRLNDWLQGKGIFEIEIRTDYPDRGIEGDVFSGPDISRLLINMIAGEFGFTIADYPTISEFSE